ncbi:MAG: hypothetical protein KDJ29_09715 [Hyphomicrobiales bacterium]|nr:hypothetical protein [Hyphomicrobiales bacterium]
MMSKLKGLAAGAAVALAAMTAQATAKDLVYASPLPPKHVVNVKGVVPMIEALKSKVKIQFVGGGQIFNFKAALSGVANRSADITTVVPSYFQSKLPNASMMFNAVLLGDHELVTQGAAEQTIMIDCPDCKQDFIRNKTMYLGGFATGGMAYLCNKEVSKVEDLKGLKIRTSGAIGRWAARAGGVPVSMSPGDMVEAINRGQIDCIGGFNAWYKSYPVSDAVKTIYSFPMGTTAAVGFMIVNRRTWKGLKSGQRRAIIDALPQASSNIVVGYIGEAYAALDLAKTKNTKHILAGKAFDAMWETHKKTEYDAIIAAAKKAGSKNPKKVLDTYLANREKWKGYIKEAGLWEVTASSDKKPADLDGAAKKFAALLNKHIYSKINPDKY